ncbi:MULTISPECIES: enoyl-ACP reductase FabV [Flavobacterium]|uniref:Enoyl-[acyl-carrier-protein] reductase [NADH] n=1 Tax=Flavobacterium johnsoniae (strain ATCC 17061 / DSM 2064 / JCM 8514 / BCRC 14874 / CCUG 350202 / NBRC 14942 / NCIMB 11054 / UW101) TaxID=376686 RepID=FABV_FLAJ1|nr:MULTISPECIES: enoyl-ACP reductase FabV [Flavobacterium]A5FE91.1 RecName: Full=Enoyl-[acyl-carrier-protein] reductase [NADH]; Short=ENR [Flavobacterium johnsoniae UW101]ABQ06478.1 Trans-2-enoyl-CoA reductase (NAD(+)) [Flavobacterium johnsoniae UW101]OXE95197.1 trans-2-enoyl-CoA reductase [Flavobacterium johnsoniae UW101]WDF61425.1 trans-2-enoyl-CoA reductase family protein [Flavobacterium sp. KACC 22758]WQG82229.1 enoyl-ACP reductase FabV [Flavobacterium johnsoniae UW101]SHK76825.1 enoyl-[a
MIIEPRMRGFICLTAHPAGCEQNVKNQIEYIKSKGAIAGAKKVLVIGASTGFGLASRITSAFGSDAATIGVFFEKPPVEGKTASPGWYNSAAFEKEAHKAGLYAKSINGDAFSNEIKRETLDLIKADLGQVDLVIYSLASPVRTNPNTGVTHRSVLKPIGQTFTNKTVDFHTGNVSEVSIAPANEEDIENTVAVMGGEDWAMWIDALKNENLLAEGATTIAYSYIGPELTEAVYRKGTIGRAKDHLEATAFTITDTLKSLGGKAYVSVNKALVTQASSAIPVIPLYISLLYKIMKEEGIHEGCIEQIQRLFQDRLYNGSEVPVDEKGRIRIDDWEMREDVQAKVAALWKEATTETLPSIGDLAGYRNDFLNLFGFEFAGVDYKADTNEVVNIESIK